jgi:hypothetical protein
MKNINCTINIEVANLLSVECGLMFSKLEELYLLSITNKELKYENEYYIKATKDFWQQTFPFLNSRKITSIFKKLEEHGYIKKCDHFKQVVYKPILDRLKVEVIEAEIVEPWPNFEDFMNNYDKRTTVHEAKSYYSRLGQQTREEIFEFVTRYKQSQPDKSLRLDPIRFLKRKKWKDEEIIGSKTAIAKSAITFAEFLPKTTTDY